LKIFLFVLSYFLNIRSTFAFNSTQQK